jgi:hypothetical protein
MNDVAEVQFCAVSLYIQNHGGLWTLWDPGTQGNIPLQFSPTVHLGRKSRKARSSVLNLSKVKAGSCRTCDKIIPTVSLQERQFYQMCRVVARCM